MPIRLLKLIGVAVIAFFVGDGLLTDDIPRAHAQAGRSTTLRNSTVTTGDAIQRQVRQALRVELAVEEPPRARLLQSRLSADGNVAVVAFSDGTLDIWSLDQGAARQKVAFPSTSNSRLEVDGAGTLLATLDVDGSVILLSAASRFDAIRVAVPGVATAIAMASWKPRVVVASADGGISVMDRAPFVPRRILSTPSGAAVALDVAADGGRVLAGFSDGALVLLAEERDRFSERGRWTIPGLRSAVLTATGAVALDGDGRLMSVTPGRQPTVVDAPISPTRLFGSGDGGYAIFDGGGRIAVWPVGGTPRVISIGRTPAVDMQLQSGGRALLVRRDSGWIEAFDVALGESMFRLIGARSGWAVVDRNGRYDGALDALAEVGWRADGEFLDMDRFSTAYFEPGLIHRYLNDRRDFMTAPPQPLADGAELQTPPEVRLTATADAQSGNAQLTARIASATGQTLGKIIVMQNGRALPQSVLSGRNSAPADRRTETQVTATASLQPGANRFQVVVRSNDDLKTSSNVIELDGGKRVKQPERLSITSIGIDQYAASELRLRYAVEDAKSVAERFATSRAYSSVKPLVTLGLNAQAKRADILGRLRELEKLSPDDVAVVFLAGHGAADGLNWWFVPQDAASITSVDQLKSIGISSDDMIEQLLRIPPSRVLLIVDTCQSGSVVDNFGRFRQRRALKKIADEAGIHILASTRPDQKAVEYPKYKHGLFTYVMLFALTSAPDGHLYADQAPKDGVVSVSELRRFVETEVPALARALQTESSATRGGGDSSGLPTHSEVTPVSGRYGKDFRLF